MIVPQRKDGNERQGDDAYTAWKIPSFNGIGAIPESWAGRLGELTGRSDLINLTLVPLRPYTHKQRLMSSMRRWCPLCFAEAEAEDRAYGQLLWDIAAVEACPKHGIRLVDRCECIGKDSHTSRNKIYLPGICEWCGRPLSQTSAGFIEIASDDQIKRSRLIADFLSDMEKLKGGTARISVFLENAIQHFAEGNAALFGKKVGIKKNTLHGWIHNRFMPTFPQLVEIALACQCSILDIMTGSQISDGQTGPITSQSRQKPFRTKAAGTFVRSEITSQLRILLSAAPPVSVCVAAKKIGVDRRTLYAEFSDLTQKISRRFREYRSAEKARKFMDKCEAYRKTAERLIQGGTTPTPRLVALSIRGKRVIIKGYEKEACGAICKDVIQEST